MSQEKITWIKLPKHSNYMVSETGEIYSLKTNRILKKQITKRGYYEVKLSEKGKTKTHLLHRLVALCFFGKSTLTVNHKDSNKLNNHLINLEYCTQTENMKHAFENELMESGIDRYNSKLNIKDIFYILNQKGKKSTMAIGKEVGVDQSTIVRIQNGKRYKREYKLWLDQR